MFKLRHTVASLEAHLRSVGRDMLKAGCSEAEVRAGFARIVERVELDVDGTDEPFVWAEKEWTT